MSSLPGLIGAVVFGVGWSVYRHYRPGDPDRKPGRVARSFEWLLVGYFRLVFLPFTLLGRGWRRLRKMENPGERVLYDRIEWPKIYYDGERYTVLGHYQPPGNEKRAARMTVIAVLLIAGWQIGTWPTAQMEALPWESHVFKPVIVGGVIVYLLWRFQRRTLRMTIGPDGIRWRNGGWLSCRVLPVDMPGAVAEVPQEHSKAADERETDALNGKQTYPVYRIASEVLLHSGFGLRDTTRVAEIHKDRHGKKAKKIQVAVNAALLAFEGDAERKRAEAEALRPLD